MQVRVQGPQKLRETITNTTQFLVLAPNHSRASAQAASAVQTGALRPSSWCQPCPAVRCPVLPLADRGPGMLMCSHPLSAFLCLLTCCSHDLLGEISFGSGVTHSQAASHIICLQDE